MIEVKSINIFFQKNKKIILSVVAGIVLIAIAYSFFSSPIKNSAREEMILTIPAMGGLIALDSAMNENADIRRKVTEILSYDEAYIFVNSTQIDALVADIMFLWIGLTSKEIAENNRQELAEIFIRRFYNLPKDEPIKNNPFLKDRPWVDLFQEIKAKILMQGQGYKIYDGVAYYNSLTDKMVIEGTLSQDYLEGFGEFVRSQPKDQQKRYINNYLLFVGETLGFKNLKEEEKKTLKSYGFL